jgi:hypothetical protein
MAGLQRGRASANVGAGRARLRNVRQALRRGERAVHGRQRLQRAAGRVERGLQLRQRVQHAQRHLSRLKRAQRACFGARNLPLEREKVPLTMSTRKDTFLSGQAC